MNPGLQLRTAREARGLSIDGLARATRVQERILDAIEHNNARAIPPRPYGRGFVRAYAAEVGLDPEATVRAFFAQFAPAPDGPATLERAPARPAPLGITPIDRRWRTVLIVVMTCLAAATLVVAVGRGVLERRPESHAVATGGTTVPSSAPAGTVGKVTVKPPPVRAMVVLEATRRAWVAATVDGRRTIYRTFQPGERVELSGESAIRVRVGDAGAVRWQVNGRPAETMGRSGDVRTAVVTPENGRTTK